MAWSSPPTAVSGAVATAADFNVLRDDLNFLKGSAGAVTIDDVLKQSMARQGGSTSNWGTTGTTNYTETGVFSQTGMTSLAFVANNNASVTVTLPTALSTSNVGLAFATFYGSPQATFAANLQAVVSGSTAVVITAYSTANQTFTCQVAWLVIGR